MYAISLSEDQSNAVGSPSPSRATLLMLTSAASPSGSNVSPVHSNLTSNSVPASHVFICPCWAWPDAGTAAPTLPAIPAAMRTTAPSRTIAPLRVVLLDIVPAPSCVGLQSRFHWAIHRCMFEHVDR